MTRTEILQTAKPILFNTEMVRAILRNDKSVTRRKVKPQPPKEADGIYERMDNGNFQMKVSPYESIYDYEIIPPYKVGDYLYVQETWSEDKHNYLYRANFSDEALEKLKNIMRWVSLKLMPRKAARIFLRVTDVRVERLQDIITGDYRTPLNINKEGLILSCCFCTHHNGDCKDFIAQHSHKTLTCKLLEDYILLWNSTVKKSDLDKYGWDANPWVWVIEFERVEVE